MSTPTPRPTGATGETPATTQARILIIDDEKAVRTLLEMALQDSPHVVESVATAEEAMEAIRLAAPDLMIVDKNLPGMNGVELIRKVREEHENVWSIMITGYPSVSSAIDTLHLGVYGYLEKPFKDVFAVAKRVNEVVSLKKKCDRLKSTTDKLRSLSKVYQDAPRPKVVVGCPDPTDRAWMIEKLQTDTEAVGFGTSRELLSVVRRSPPHLIILDGALKDPDLLRLAIELKAVVPDSLCMVICEKPTVKLVSQLIDAGVKSVVERPLVEDRFRRKVESVLRFHRLKALAETTPGGRA